MQSLRTTMLGTALLALLALGVTGAIAGGLGHRGSIKDGPYEGVLSWTGFYVGVNGGYGWNANDVLNDGPLAPFKFDGLAPAGGFVGGQIGFNWQRPGSRIVLGIEADIQGAGLEDDATVLGRPVKASLDWFGTVRGRIGYATDKTLIYVTGGVAFGGVDDEVTIVNGTFFESDDTQTGYVVGGGFEYKLNAAWSLKAEYQYLDFGHNQPHAANGTPLNKNIWTIEDDAFHTARVGLNYRFGQ